VAADHSRYVPRVQPFTDSIGYGVGAATLAAWREGAYNSSIAVGKTLRFVGSQSFAGNSGGLAADPDCECIPGATIFGVLNPVTFRMATYSPDIVVAAAGTNDIDPAVGNHSAATALSDLSTWLDLIWSFRPYPWFQIVLANILRRKDAADSTAQTFNAGIAAVVAGKSYRTHITTFDQYNALLDADYNDAVHPNDAGYTKLAAIYGPAIRSALGVAQATML